MSKREFLSRYNLIIGKLRRTPATFKEIAEYLELQSEVEGSNFTISKRTFIRDLDEIRSLYNIDIQYNYFRRVYEIESEQTEVNDRILEAFDIFNTLNIGESLTGLIHFEKRRPQGTENLFGLLHAIKNQMEITFTYQKYWEEELTQRIVEPYALKEFKNRWYVLAKDTKDNRIKSFALDRLTHLEIGKKKFKRPIDFNINEYYKHCFGIISPEKGQFVEEIILSFSQVQGRYIKSLPFHESQEIIIDNEEELRIKLKIYVTYDFLMEVLSYGDNVKVIQPESLINVLKTSYRQALVQY